MYLTEFTIGGSSVSASAVISSLALLLGLGVTWAEGRQRIGSSEKAVDAGLCVIVGGIVGGWLGYVVTNWTVLEQDWSRATQVWESRLPFPWVFLGGLAAMRVFALVYYRRGERRSFWEWVDMVTPGLALGVSLLWIVSLALGARFNYLLLPDIYGVNLAVGEVLITRYGLDMPPLAVQGVGIALALALGAAFWLARKRWSLPGAAFLMFTLIYFTGQFLLETLLNIVLAETPLRLGPWQLAASFPWRLDQVLEMGLALFATARLLVLWRQARKQVEPRPRKRVYPVCQIAVGLGVISLVAASIASVALWQAKTANPDFLLTTISPDIPRISPQAARAQVERGEAILADIRDPASYTEAHAAGAISLPEEEALARLEQLPRDKTMILYCA